MSTNLDNTYDALAWGSHLPALLACVAAGGPKPVLELGVGHFSTPALHALCGALKKHLISVEDTLDWHDQFAMKYASEAHAFIFKPYDEALDLLLELGHVFGCVLIDNSPGGARRLEDFQAVLPIANYVVVHDYHRENEEAIAPLLKGLSYHVTRTYEPPTLVASKFLNPPSSILRL